jgi:signal transduction histidine kinase
MSSKSKTIEELHSNFEDYCDLIEFSPVAMGAQCEDKIIFMNSAGSDLLDASSPYALFGKSLIDFIHPDHKALVQNSFAGLEKEKGKIKPLEVKIASENEANRYLELAASTFNYKNKNAIQFTLHEITKRKEMENLIIQSKHDWEETFHAITDMVTVHDKDFNIIYANKAAEQILQLPNLKAKMSRKCFEYYHGTDCPPTGCPSCDCLKTGVSANFEIFEPHLDMYIEIRSMPRFDQENNLIGLIHIARDVTSRKKAEDEIKRAKDELELRVDERTIELSSANEKLKEEISERKMAVEALQKSENKYRNLSQQFNTLLDGIPFNLLLLSPELKILWANKAVASLFKKNASDLAGDYCYSLCCNIISPCENCPTMRSFQTGQEESSEITTDEGKIWDIMSFPIKDESGNIKTVIELARDITEKSNLQASATRTKHLASIGELAAGVAHEINNPINNIMNYAQILIDEFKDEGRDDSVARRVIKDGDRIATIVRSLLSFARIRKEEKSLMSLNDIFSDTMSLTSAQLRKDGIHLNVDIPNKILRIPIHPQQIQQVFLNIISNARFALNEKYPGTHDDKTLNITCEESAINDNPFVRILFHDRGMGIPENIIDKIINPFFSTKPNNVGTGLGLSISHGIINEHNGKLLIDSHEGEYTRITVVLPVVYGEENES